MCCALEWSHVPESNSTCIPYMPLYCADCQLAYCALDLVCVPLDAADKVSRHAHEQTRSQHQLLLHAQRKFQVRDPRAKKGAQGV